MSCEWAFISMLNDDVQIIDKNQHMLSYTNYFDNSGRYECAF